MGGGKVGGGGGGAGGLWRRLGLATQRCAPPGHTHYNKLFSGQFPLCC